MIQTVTYRARLDGKNGGDVVAHIQPVLDRMLAGRVELLGGSIQVQGTSICSKS